MSNECNDRISLCVVYKTKFIWIFKYGSFVSKALCIIVCKKKLNVLKPIVFSKKLKNMSCLSEFM